MLYLKTARQLSHVNTPLNLCSVCGGLGVACLGEIHIRHAFMGCVKSDNTLDSHITTLEPAVLASLYIENPMCYATHDVALSENTTVTQ